MTDDKNAELRRVVTAKPLEWNRQSYPGVSIAHTGFGSYWAYSDGELALGDFRMEKVEGRSLSETEAAAEADYELRSLANITLASRALPAANDGRVEKPAAWRTYDHDDGRWFLFHTEDDAKSVWPDHNVREPLHTPDQVTRLCEQTKREAYSKCAQVVRNFSKQHSIQVLAKEIEALAEKKT